MAGASCRTCGDPAPWLPQAATPGALGSWVPCRPSVCRTEEHPSTCHRASRQALRSGIPAFEPWFSSSCGERVSPGPSALQRQGQSHAGEPPRLHVGRFCPRCHAVMSNGGRRVARVFEPVFVPCYLPSLQERVRVVGLKRTPAPWTKAGSFGTPRHRACGR
jgi:hypothetical protein